MNTGKLPIKPPLLDAKKSILVFTLVFFVCLTIASPFDEAWSLYWAQNATPLMKLWSRFVHQGIFINGRAGVTDITWVILAWSIHKYYKSKTRAELKDNTLGYLFFFSNTILLSIGVTRGLKVLFARPRPYDWSAGTNFPYWYEFHQNLLAPEKLFSFHGSMPSGHTISIVCLLGLLPFFSKKTIWVRVMALCFIALLTLAVGYGRVVKGAHWLTDCLCSGLIGGFLTWFHLRFFETKHPVNHRKYFINIILISIALMLVGVLSALALRYSYKIH